MRRRRRPGIQMLSCEIPGSRLARPGMTLPVSRSSLGNGFAVIAGGARSCAHRMITHKHLPSSSFEARPRGLAPQDAVTYYAPIAIFGSASAFAFNSFSARRYSTGITLRNFGRDFFQLDRISAARIEPVSLA